MTIVAKSHVPVSARRRPTHGHRLTKPPTTSSRLKLRTALHILRATLPLAPAVGVTVLAYDRLDTCGWTHTGDIATATILAMAAFCTIVVLAEIAVTGIYDAARPPKHTRTSSGCRSSRSPQAP